MILVTDFDGTLVSDRWPEIGDVDYDLVQAFIAAKKAGHKVILNTCRKGEQLEKAVRFLKFYGLTFDGVNENLLDEFQGLSDCRKIFGDFYYDDRSFNWDRDAALWHVCRISCQAAVMKPVK
ncbi:MAG: hypothetical protein PHI87_04130 [Candidatus Methanomethylophilus sp.]|nr:hypothetical protein [Methanomethylophilus sp.]